jgi:hypothetical protein
MRRKAKTKQTVPSGRIALRVEGLFWNAYFAKPDTMEGALLLGSIRMSLVADNSRVKAHFMTTMRMAIAAIHEEMGSEVVKWSQKHAPESERGGNA